MMNYYDVMTSKLCGEESIRAQQMKQLFNNNKNKQSAFQMSANCAVV